METNRSRNLGTVIIAVGRNPELQPPEAKFLENNPDPLITGTFRECPRALAPGAKMSLPHKLVRICQALAR